MYGYISNNLIKPIEKYIKNKTIPVEYSYTKPIAKKLFQSEIENINKSNINCIIIDSSSFSEEEQMIEFCYNLKMLNNKIRIILIAFNKNILSKAAMIGIYDIIYYEKNNNLIEKLDDIIIKPLNLSDIRDILNLNHINNNVYVNKEIILFISLDRRVYTTTFILNYLNSIDNKKILFDRRRKYI